MKLKEAIELAKASGLSTIGEAVYNIKLHAINIFEYSKIEEEYRELVEDTKKIYKEHGYTPETNIDDVVKS